MELSEVPPLKYTLSKHFQSVDFETDNVFLLEHLNILKIKYPNENIQSIEYASRECTRLAQYHGNQKLIIKSNFDVPIHNIYNVNLLKDLISFFEPRDYLHETIFRLSEKVSKLENIILQQSMSIQNIKENTTNTNNIVENIVSNL